MEQILVAMTIVLAKTLIQTGAIPAPRSQEELNSILDLCYLKLVMELVEQSILEPAPAPVNAQGSSGN